jgi:hypothetical protein
MNDQNIDVNLIIQSFQERINQLTTEAIIKDATIKQLMLQIENPASVEKKEQKDK